MYYIASLAKFDNCCSIQYGLVGKTNGRGTTIVFPFEGCGKKIKRFFYSVFLDMIFYPRILQYFQVSKTIPALAYLVALTIQHSCYRAQTFEVCGPKLYQSENKFSPLFVRYLLAFLYWPNEQQYRLFETLALKFFIQFLNLSRLGYMLFIRQACRHEVVFNC